MIESIHVAKTATYRDTPESLTKLKTFNYLYGSNGSGKTTISKVIAKPGDPAHASCRLEWKGNAPLQTLVYNRDFVTANFGSGPIKGVFTLGKQSVEDAENLRLAKVAVAEQDAKLFKLQETLQGPDGLGGKTAELNALDDGLQETCWKQKLKHEAKLSGAFAGFLKKAKFKEKILLVHKGASIPGNRPTLADLYDRAKTVFGTAPTDETPLTSASSVALVSRESDPILQKVVVGSKDVDIAAMVDKLGASDWVKQGRPFFEKNDGDCPFCQQPAPVSLNADLAAYFDGAFVADTNAIDSLASAYASDGKSFLATVDAALASSSPRLEKDVLEAQRKTAAAKIEVNSRLIEAKRKEPSRPFVLDGLKECADSIAATLAKANAAIIAHNKMVANLEDEKEKLTAQVWRNLVEEELAVALADYAKKKNGLDKAVENLNRQIKESTQAKSDKEVEIRALERSSTSVQPTVDQINELLRSYGFRSFSLVRVGEGNNYALHRADQTDARETLSEGEKSFVTFLYFYHLLEGSPSDSGQVAPRVAVFDDPVSSLDSDVLFIVSSLLHQLMEQVRNPDRGHPVKQVFVLTHNVHFFREVTFNADRPPDGVMREESFWVVRKPGGDSRVEPSQRNPVSSSYEMLWQEIRRKDVSLVSVQNTLRRILESYFKHLGGIDPRSLDRHFEGNDKVVCKSLFSWINAGSHNFDDNLYFTVDAATVENHLRVFKKIFEHSKHDAHYRMMMREQSPEEQLA